MDSVEREILPAELDGEVSPDDAVGLARLLAERFSCRAFRDDPVPRTVIDRMLGIAQMSASWYNSQPWQVIVTEGAATERLRDVLYARANADFREFGMPKMDGDFAFPGSAHQGVYKERAREVGWQLYESVGIAQGDRVASAQQALENFRLFGAPHALIVTTERYMGAYGAIDCGLYTGTLMLAAQALGIGIIPQAALAGYSSLIRSHFGIPDNRMVVVGASFGYPDLDHPVNRFRSKRAPVSNAITWETE